MTPHIISFDGELLVTPVYTATEDMLCSCVNYNVMFKFFCAHAVYMSFMYMQTLHGEPCK